MAADFRFVAMPPVSRTLWKLPAWPWLAGRNSYASYHLRLSATAPLLGPPLLGSTYTT